MENDFKFKKGFGDILLIACGALAKETIAIIEHNNLRHLDVQCLPAALHHRPALIPYRLETILSREGKHYKKVFVLYGDCGTAGKIDQVLEKYNAQRIPGPHCFAFYEGNERFANNDDDITSFFLTDFFCRNFETFIWQEFGLDKNESMVDFVFGNYKKIVYIAQTEQPHLKEKAMDIASKLELEFEYRFRGYSDMGDYIQTLTL